MKKQRKRIRKPVYSCKPSAPVISMDFSKNDSIGITTTVEKTATGYVYRMEQHAELYLKPPPIVNDSAEPVEITAETRLKAAKDLYNELFKSK